MLSRARLICRNSPAFSTSRGIDFDIDSPRLPALAAVDGQRIIRMPHDRYFPGASRTSRHDASAAEAPASSGSDAIIERCSMGARRRGPKRRISARGTERAQRGDTAEA